MELTLESNADGTWTVSQGRGSPEQVFQSVSGSAAWTAENGSRYLHFQNATLTDNGDGTATIS